MNRWKIGTIVFAGLFATSVGVNYVRSVEAEPQPHMRAALGGLESALGELLIFDLRSQVVRLEAFVALETFVARVAFVIQDRVDADGVRVAAGAGADDDDFAAELFLDAIHLDNEC